MIVTIKSNNDKLVGDNIYMILDTVSTQQRQLIKVYYVYIYIYIYRVITSK